MEYVIVGIGGALGSIARYSLGKAISSKYRAVFPVATFIINIIGAILLGIISNVGVTGNLYLLLADGFLGAYTTFSTFMYEGFTLFKDKQTLNALIYVLSSLLLGVVGFVIGSFIGTAIS
jgi:fluoride exporter